MKYSYDEIINQLKKSYDPDIESKLLRLWLTGSQVYGNATTESDWDYCAITTVATQSLFDKDKVRFLTLRFFICDTDCRKNSNLICLFLQLIL